MIIKILTLMFVSFSAFAMVSPEQINESVVEAVVYFITNFKTMGTLAISVSIVNFGTYFISKYSWFGEYKRLIVTSLGMVNAVLMMLVNGEVWWKALIYGVVSSGLGVAVYEAYKGLKKVGE